ncbi:NUDIX domain-containing protein [Treponema sp.]|uniref:NUDIX hydrolase n=1 Tax=Treponema sp. TaxID=166 RepID=UPI00388E99C0
MKNDFTFCPECGSKNIQNVKMRKWLCSDCGFDLYNNVASAVGLLIQTKEGKILLEKRAKEPRKGFLAFPGGFVDPDETLEEACFRECKEETGVEPVSLKYIASFPNTYEYKNIQYKTCDVFFEAKLPVNAELHAQEGEVLGFSEVSVQNEKELAEVPLAFESARKTLELWLKMRR